MTVQQLPPSGGPAPSTRGAGVWGPWQTLGWGLVIGFASLLAQVLVAAGFVIAEMSTASGRDFSEVMDAVMAKEGLLVSLSSIASALVGVMLIAVTVRARRGAPFAEYLGLRRPSKGAVLASLGLAIGLVVLTGVVTSFLGETSGDRFTVDVYRTAVWPALLWPAVVVFAPVFEESFFRGFLFEGFRRSRIGVAGTIVLTALAWSALHLQYSPFGIAVIFGWGIALGIVRWKTGSLWNALALHAFINFLATLAAATGTQ